MAAPEAKTTIYVKGDPATKTLGDCPFCHRALLTYEAKKVPYTLEYIDFANKPAWLQEASGGKVPVIKEGPNGKYIPDSDVIVVHLEDKVPEPSMKSSVPPEIGAKLFPAFRGILLGPAEEVEAKKEALVAELQGVEGYLREHVAAGPLFGGHSLNATDASLAPKLYHTVVALKHFRGWELPAEFTAIRKRYRSVSLSGTWTPSSRCPSGRPPTMGRRRSSRDGRGTWRSTERGRGMGEACGKLGGAERAPSPRQCQRCTPPPAVGPGGALTGAGR